MKRKKPDPEQLMLELKRFSDFSERDLTLLRALGTDMEPHLREMADSFYQFIQGNAGSRDLLYASGAPIDQLKGTLMEWARSLFHSERDRKYGERRLIIGERHALIGIPQKYTLGAIQMVRSFFHRKIADHHKDRPQDAFPALEAMNRALDLDTTLISEAYIYSECEKGNGSG